MTFIQYGKGGQSGGIDNTDQWVYLTAIRYLVRVPRNKLPDLNRADFQYYKGDGLDGMLDSSWSTRPEDGKPWSPPETVQGGEQADASAMSCTTSA